jgi:hypothetical protein
VDLPEYEVVNLSQSDDISPRMIDLTKLLEMRAQKVIMPKELESDNTKRNILRR